MAATAPRAAWLETPYPRTLRNELISSAACQESRPDCMSSSRKEERSVAVNFSGAFEAGELISMAILLPDNSVAITVSAEPACDRAKHLDD